MKSLLLIGPFESARIRAKKFAEGMYRIYVLQDLLEQLELTEKAILESEDETEKKMAEMVKEQLENNLNFMISPPGIQENDEEKTHKIFRKTL